MNKLVAKKLREAHYAVRAPPGLKPGDPCPRCAPRGGKGVVAREVETGDLVCLACGWRD